MGYFELERRVFGAAYGSATREITDLVMAAEAALNNFGKRSILGADKGREAEQNFRRKVVMAAIALQRVGLIKDASDPTQSLPALNEAMKMAQMAFPNWPRAYVYWDMFIDSMDERPVAVAAPPSSGPTIPKGPLQSSTLPVLSVTAATQPRLRPAAAPAPPPPPPPPPPPTPAKVSSSTRHRERFCGHCRTLFTPKTKLFQRIRCTYCGSPV
jgi:hypothetical protein